MQIAHIVAMDTYAEARQKKTDKPNSGEDVLKMAERLLKEHKDEENEKELIQYFPVANTPFTIAKVS